ncbi:transglycosylase domain-containing protein [Streptomyces phyllanthi]|uniref:Penicillin-binding protein n=1 Tax=Streptomyces phyllanthi TaxID=1803180 RepID=A0A5N8VZA3_9ACTN|nr:transglycosylase domain-containing protein [Streptomyces phyllanthi]MPY39378.1 penicillin-binding protein [Streptomyces phyllanthi]
MSEHRRKPPQPQEGGRAAARRGQSAPSGRRASPRGATGSLSGTYGSGGEERAYGGRAEARRAAQRSGGGGRRRAAPDSAGRGPGRGRGRAAPPSRTRIIDYPRAGRYGAARWVPSWRLVTGLFIAFFGSLVAVAGIGYALVGVPDPAKTAQAQNNVYYWDNGSQMVSTGGETNRQIIPYSKIPKEMRYAVMSAENKTFETDSGIDPMGIARALFNMAKGGETQGGSTITQQYVKNAMLDDQSQTLSRKFKELFISIKVGAQEPKEEVMAGYLNTAYFGREAYGIQAAARAYFNKEADKLNASECAFLAAVLKGATYYDPAGAPEIDPVAATAEKNRKRATERWRWILDEMVKDKRISAAERAKYTTFPKIESPRSNTALGGQVGYLVALAKAYIIKNTDITESQLRQGGYEIHTTFSKKKVDQLSKAVEKVRKENIKPKLRPKTDTHVEFGGASVDPDSGAIRAIYGGSDATKHFTNNADQTGAQVGSTFKPFVLAAAMKWGVRDKDGDPVQAQDERTIVSPKSLFSGQNDLKIRNYDGTVWQNEDGEEWLQANDGDESYGTPPNYNIDLREAMRVSANSAFVQLGMDVGLDKVKESAVDAGLLQDSLTGTGFPSFSIGISDPSAIRMAGAYATFAASGKQRDLYSVKEVEDKTGVVFQHQDVAKTKQAFTSKVADNVTDVLKTVVDEGTGTAAQLTGRDVAGKTGTTDGNKSAWFVGYTPQLSTAIGMYRMDDDEKQKNRQFLEMYGTGGQQSIHGASFPAEIWHDYMEQALKGEESVDFPEPEPIGVIVNDDPDPTPTPTVTESDDEDTEPSPTPTETESEPSPTPSKPCNNPFDPTCNTDTGGTDTGGTDTGGTDGGVTATPTETEGSSRGNGNGGGLFGGTDG